MNELISEPRGPDVASESQKVHVIVDGEHADDPKLREALASIGAGSSTRVCMQYGDDPLHGIEGANRVIVVGDDRFVNRVVWSVMSVDFERRPVLGIVPLGSPTDLAHSAGVSPSFERALFDALVGAPRRVDVGRWGRRWFVNVVCGGALCEQPLTDRRLSRVMGGLAYALAGIMRLPAMRPVELEIRGESFAWSGSVYALAIGNARTIGGGFGVCPHAAIADGELDVTLIPASLELAEVLEIIDERGVAGVAEVHRFRSPWVELRARSTVHFDIDGELQRCVRTRFDLVCGALELVLPPSSPLLEAPTPVPASAWTWRPTRAARAGW